MTDLTILHLSDLHIEATGDDYSRVLKSLLTDIEKETEHLEPHSLIVTVTGDIFNKGPAYNDSENPQVAYNNALKFFTDLKDKLKDKVFRIYFVPGNHDKFRNTLDEYLSSACRGDMSKSLDKQFYDKVWPVFLDNYSKERGTGYLELFQEVYKLFHSEPDKITKTNSTFLEKTYGIDTFKLKDKDYCVVMLNTAWTCLLSDDRNLFIGEFQFEQIMRQFKKKYSSTPPALTIVLGHHPTSFLHGKEEDALMKQLISYDKIDANLYICGHRHIQDASNWNNNRHSLNTFISGIGWPEESEPEGVGLRTYAFYDIDADANAIEVHMRATIADGSFKPNFSKYTGDLVDESLRPKTSMAFPLRAESAQHYIKLSRAGDEDSKAYYLSSDLVSYIQNYQNTLAETCFEVSRVYEEVCADMYMDVDDAEFSKKHENEEIRIESEKWWNYLIDEEVRNKYRPEVKKYFDKYKDKTYSFFHSYLFQICTIMGAQFSLDDVPKDKIRFHFRYYSKQSELYKNLCVSIDTDDYRVRDIKYGQLIQAAYETKKSLIYSVNKTYAEGGIADRWTDFITVIPSFAGNKIVERKKTGRKNISKELPAITFGVTIGDKRYENLLYSLDFFKIGDIINTLVDYFFSYFEFDLEGFCEWYDRTCCNGGQVKCQ